MPKHKATVWGWSKVLTGGLVYGFWKLGETSSRGRTPCCYHIDVSLMDGALLKRVDEELGKLVNDFWEELKKSPICTASSSENKSSEGE